MPMRGGGTCLLLDAGGALRICASGTQRAGRRQGDVRHRFRLQRAARLLFCRSRKGLLRQAKSRGPDRARPRVSGCGEAGRRRHRADRLRRHRRRHSRPRQRPDPDQACRHGLRQAAARHLRAQGVGDRQAEGPRRQEARRHGIQRRSEAFRRLCESRENRCEQSDLARCGLRYTAGHADDRAVPTASVSSSSASRCWPSRPRPSRFSPSPTPMLGSISTATASLPATPSSSRIRTLSGALSPRRCRASRTPSPIRRRPARS